MVIKLLIIKNNKEKLLNRAKEYYEKTKKDCESMKK